MRENVSILFLLNNIWYLKDMNTYNNIQYSNNIININNIWYLKDMNTHNNIQYSNNIININNNNNKYNKNYNMTKEFVWCSG